MTMTGALDRGRKSFEQSRVPNRKDRSEVTAPFGRTLDTARAVDWVRGSFAQGSDLAALVGAKLATLPIAVLLVDPSRAPRAEPVLDDNGRGVPSSEADDAAKRLFAGAARAAKLTLIVEDDLARRSDSHVAPAAFVGDRVLRWVEIDDGAGGAVTLLRQGSSGYPLNAYLCLGVARELGLAAGAELGPLLQERIAEAVVGVVVSVWDAEAFVAVLSPGLSD